MIKTIYFITHPNVQVNPELPPDQWSLSQKGYQRLDQLSQESFWLEVQHIFASYDNRGQETGKYLAQKHNLPLQQFPGLHEYERRESPFLSLNDLRIAMRMFFKRPKESIFGWERALDAQNRIRNTLHQLIDEYPDLDTIAICSHGVIGSLLRSELMGHPIEESLCQEEIGAYLMLDWEHQSVVSEEWHYF